MDHHPEYGVGLEGGVGVADQPGGAGIAEMADRIGHGHVGALAQRRSEAFLGAGELGHLVHRPVVDVPLQRGPDPPLDPQHRVVDPGDGLLLAAPQVLLGFLEDGEQQGVFRLEVPVEDALAHTDTQHDLGHGGGVVPALGEPRRGVIHELAPPLLATGGQSAVHLGTVPQASIGRSASRGPLSARDENASRARRVPETSRSPRPRTVISMKTTYIVRVWMPDRPGALGALTSRIGAVGGDVVGIDILERGADRVIDELVVELPGEELVDLLVAEIQEVDGVDVEDVRLVALALHDPRLDALETAAILVGAPTPEEAIEELCTHAVRTIGANWGAIIELESDRLVVAVGDVPSPGWLAAFVAGSQNSARLAGESSGPSDVAWSPLPSARLALVLGRDGQAFRARERRQAAALARIVDTRFRELRAMRSRLSHPSVNH